MKKMLFCVVMTAFYCLVPFYAFAQRMDTAFRYDNGTVSSRGTLVDGRPDGYWYTYYPDGTLKSEGGRENFRLSGKWIFYDRNGLKETEIEYRDGIKNGHEKSYRDGVLFSTIPYRNNIKEGRSYAYYPDGRVAAENVYMNDVLYGRGFEYSQDGVVITIVTYRDGRISTTSRINRRNSKEQKQGLWVWFREPDMDIEHQGTYRNGLRHGYFKYYDEKGNLVRTEKYVDDILQSNAVETSKIEVKREYYASKQLKSYVSYRAGKKDGLSVFYDEKGNVASAEVYFMGHISEKGGTMDSEGKKNGRWEQYYPEGGVMSYGDYRDGNRTGEWTYLFPDGKVSQKGSFVSGKENGEWVWYYPSGEILRKEEYYMGREEGTSVEYGRDGSVVASGSYEAGMRQGKWFFINGDSRDEGVYADGQRDGLWTTIDIPSGKTVFSGYYRDGQPDGRHVLYYVSGAKKAEGDYVSGLRSGQWIFYDENGSEVVRVTYRNGQEVMYDSVGIGESGS